MGDITRFCLFVCFLFFFGFFGVFFMNYSMKKTSELFHKYSNAYPVVLENNNTIFEEKMEGNILFNDALNTFYLRLYGVGHMVKDHSDSERGNPLPPHRLLLPINNKDCFICTIPQTG